MNNTRQKQAGQCATVLTSENHLKDFEQKDGCCDSLIDIVQSFVHSHNNCTYVRYDMWWCNNNSINWPDYLRERNNRNPCTQRATELCYFRRYINLGTNREYTLAQPVCATA